jgi:hypothetical protein
VASVYNCTKDLPDKAVVCVNSIASFPSLLFPKEIRLINNFYDLGNECDGLAKHPFACKGQDAYSALPLGKASQFASFSLSLVC